MKEKDSQGEKGGDWKKTLVIIILCLIAIVLTASFAVAIYFAVASWWSGNIVKHLPQPLEVAVAVLTILVAIVAIVMGYTFIRTQSEWRKFKEETWEDADKRLEELEESQKEIKYLKKHIETDPLLQHAGDRKQLFDFAEDFINGQDMLPLKYYFAGRAYEIGYGGNISIEERLEKSILYYTNALRCGDMSPATKRRIYQAMGTSESGLGKEYLASGNQPEARNHYENAVKAFRDAFEAKANSQALDSQGNAHIELAKIASNQEEKANQLNKAIKCFDDAIQMKDKLARQWWATYHFDKARALALMANPKLDEVAKELEDTMTTFDTESVGFDVPELFKDFENVTHDNEIKRLLDHLREVKFKAKLKGG